MTTGNRMKARRNDLCIPVYDVAAALGVSVATVYRYENGDIEKVPGSILEPLAKVLHTTPAYLMGWVSDPTDNGKTDPLIEAACASLKELKPEYQKYISDQITQLLSIQRKEQET